MCLSAALVGVIVFLRKQSLIGESLSHAAYPGVILGIIGISSFINDSNEDYLLAFAVLGGAFLTSIAGLMTIQAMERYLKVRTDSALCFVLAAFFGVGITLASRIQFTHTSLYNQIQVYLYGQAATMTDVHIWIYGTLALLISCVAILCYKELQIILFDYQYAKSLGIKTTLLNATIFILIVLAVVVGIRSVGVVLMSAMLTAPAAAARQYTHKMSKMLLIAGFIGLFSGFMGNYLSVEVANGLSTDKNSLLILPTGPMIVLIASAICLLSLLLAPERGLLLRLFRSLRFRYKCLGENLLKSIWRHDPEGYIDFSQLAFYQSAPYLTLRWALWRLIRAGWVEAGKSDDFRLTTEGRQLAARIIRLHRLWEVYLADYVGVGVERVHRNAEEMEHIITPEIEAKLILLLNDPKRDPHHQPIPSKDKVL
jgi:manganese/zinc/iron transport system permease protein